MARGTAAHERKEHERNKRLRTRETESQRKHDVKVDGS